MDRLESGFLLFETEHGLVRAELSVRQRIYLLWTFRNFRQLSTPLLNSRERALVNALFRNNTGVVSPSDEQWPVIGMIENFVPTAPIKDSPVLEVSLALKRERREREEMAVPSTEIAPLPNPVSASSPRFAWSTRATVAGGLCLCIVTVAAWHRIQGMPSSQAGNQPRLQQVNALVRPSVADPGTSMVIAERPTAIAPPPTIVQPMAVADIAVKPAPIPTPSPNRKQAIRVHDAVPMPNPPLPGQDNTIQASRAPLRVVYPVCPSVCARNVVALTAGVDSEGKVRSVKVVSGNHALATAAVRAVRQWRYRPYLKDGQPVATETNIVISFISADAISMNFPLSLPSVR